MTKRGDFFEKKKKLMKNCDLSPGASQIFVIVLCCTMLVALISVAYTFTIQNAGRTQKIFVALPKGNCTFGGKRFSDVGEGMRGVRVLCIKAQGKSICWKNIC
jgi:hypothetical protein